MTEEDTFVRLKGLSANQISSISVRIHNDLINASHNRALMIKTFLEEVNAELKQFGHTYRDCPLCLQLESRIK